MGQEDADYRSAAQLFQAGDADAAEKACRRIVAKASRYAPAYYLLGLIAERQNKADAAVRSFRKAVSLHTGNPQYHLALAAAYQTQGAPDETFASLRAGVATNPNDPDLLLSYASMCVSRGLTTRAVELFRRVLEIFPGDALALSHLGVALLELGECEAASEIWDRLRRATPDEVNVINGAISRGGMGQWDRALEIIEHPIANAPASPWRKSVQDDLKLAYALRRNYAVGKHWATVNTDGLADYAQCIREGVPSTWSPELFLVFFHVIQNGTNPAIDDRRADYEELLHHAAVAGRNCVRGAKVVLLTDRDSAFQSSNFADCVVRLPMKKAWIMYERMRAQRAFAASGCLTANTLFLDSDILLSRSFDPIFAQPFDVGLTWRATVPWMPVNGGMIMARQNRSDQVVRFYDRCLAAYEHMVSLECVRERYAFDIRNFQGDQLAIAAALHWQAPPLSPEVLCVDGVDVRFFPCADVNETFEPQLDVEVLKQKYALHFKGAQKIHMRRFAQNAGIKCDLYKKR